MSLRARLALAAGVAVAIAVIAVAVSAYAGTRSQLRGQVDASLRTLSAQAIAGPHGPGGPEHQGDVGAAPVGGPAPSVTGEGTCQGDEGLGLDRLSGPAFGGAPGIFTLFNRCGGTFVPTGQRYKIPANSRIKQLASGGAGRYLTDMTVSGTHIRVLVAGIGSAGALAVALPLTDVDHTLSSQLTLLIVIAAAGIALAALLGVLVARTALAPIARFTRQTESVAERPERTEQRLEVVGRDELARLATTFNRTLDALELSVAAQRQLVADASHELRTPIATIRANLQLMRDEDRLSQEDRNALRADIIEELDELTALVGDIVELARGGRASGEPGDVSLDGIVAEAVQRLSRRGPRLDVRSRLEPTVVRGEEDRIARAVTNLLDNARKWSPPDGVVEVELHDGVLTVRDHGPGFHDEDLPYVFDRFHRAKDARSKPGSGLGLAIVRETAEAHGGFVQAANAPGGGAIARVGFGQTLALGDEPRAPSLSSQS
ncbi:MAG TPA: HAMP domain-containing sensor histidine kinase [Solirubrobacteraceae bacterium]